MQQKAILEDASTSIPHTGRMLIGHEEQMGIVQRALANQQMPHGWLFTGAKGIGKATAAYQLAHTILLGSHKIVSPLEYHPDLLVLKKKQNEKTSKMEAEIKIDQIREIGGFLAYTRTSGPYRVIMVDSIDDVTVNAANALLKHLEEPPPHTVFFLINHRPELVLPTIISRCVRLRFQPLSDIQVNRVLKGILPADSLQHEAWLAAYAGGSPGMAVTLLAATGYVWLEQWVELLCRLPVYTMDKIHHFIDQVVVTKSDEVFVTVLYILYRLLSRVVCYQAGGLSSQKLLDIERRLCDHKPLQTQSAAFIPVIQEIGGMVTDPKIVHAERAATLLRLFDQLQKL